MNIIGLVKDWFGIVFLQKQPSEILKDKPGWKEGLIRISLAAFVFAALMVWGVSSVELESIKSLTGMMAVSTFFSTVIMTVVFAAVYYLIAKFLKGKGSMERFFGTFASVQAAYNGLGMVLLIVVGIAFTYLGDVLGYWARVGLMLLLGISWAIQSTKSIKVCFGFDKKKAILTFLMPWIVLAIFIGLITAIALSALS